MEQLSRALEDVHLQALTRDSSAIDSVLDRPRPFKRKRQSPDEVKAGLSHAFLTPSPAFSREWLNTLQQRWETSTDYTDLFALAPTQTRTIIRFTREGLEGRVTGYKEITIPSSSATAKNSTSILRKPANRADFVRGASGQFPLRLEGWRA